MPECITLEKNGLALVVVRQQPEAPESRYSKAEIGASEKYPLPGGCEKISLVALTLGPAKSVNLILYLIVMLPKKVNLKPCIITRNILSNKLFRFQGSIIVSSFSMSSGNIAGYWVVKLHQKKGS